MVSFPQVSPPEPCADVKTLNYVRNAPRCFDDSAPTSGSVNIAIAKVIK
jgi:hypothetical protein